MAQYIGYLQGNRGGTSRCGSKDSGMDAQAQGWEVGGSVTMFHSEFNYGQQDCVRLSVNGGSNGRHSGETVLVIPQDVFHDRKRWGRIREMLRDVQEAINGER